MYIHVRAPIVFNGVEIGMSRAEVIEHLGNSVRTEREMIFCAHYFLWSGACPRVSQISEFFFYKFGIDRWIVVGFDERSIFIFRIMGDT